MLSLKHGIQHVHDAQPKSSASQLLRLPAELLDHIVNIVIDPSQDPLL